MRRLFRICLVAGLGGCGTSAGAKAIDAGKGDVPLDARVRLYADDAEASAPVGEAGAEGVVTDGDANAPGALLVIPVADPDAGACHGLPTDYPGVVCFGSDPGPYAYLASDAGVAVGECPTPRDFPGPKCECCFYEACGPLRPVVVGGLTDGAASVVDEAGSASCCFWVRMLCLV